MTQEQTQEYVKGCIRGEPPPCADACPFKLDIKDFLAKTAKGKWTSAYKTYRNAVVFPAVVAELCHEPCKPACNIHEHPIEQLALEKAVIAHVKKRAADFYAIPPKDKKIAVVGASIAGLVCALGLAQKQYRVTVFDKLGGWGGTLREHPKFNIFDEDFRAQFSAVQVEFKFNAEFEGEFDAVYEAPDRGDPIYEIVEGADEAIRIETYVQTGQYPERVFYNTYNNKAGAQNRDEYIPDEEAAKTEAARCRQCDCSACLDACPMLKRYKKEPRRLALEFFTDSHVNPPLSTHSLTREAYSCTDCGACKAACPKNIDLGVMFRDYRKMRVANGTAPKAFHDIFLRRMNEFNAAGRYIPPESEYVYFPGCAVTQELGGTSERVYQYLKKRYGAGLLERCCGSPAKWSGESEDYNLDFINPELTYIYACPSCYETLHEQYHGLKLVSVYELLDGVEKQHIPDFGVTLFHACSARENETLRHSVEKLATGIELKIESCILDCCGYGGQTQFANPELFRGTVETRSTLDPRPYLVYCANCRETFKRQGKECHHILEIVFSADNGLKNKEPPLVISDEVRKFMSDNLISEADVIDVIRCAEESGEKFVTPEGTFIASRELGALTYWAEYRSLGGEIYEVLSSYYHRMKFKKA